MTESEFDAARLDAYLRDRIPDLAGPLRLARIAGGQSNPTFFVSYDTRALVLRKKPPGELLPSAHAIDREFRVLTALATTDVPVPRTLFYEASSEVIGTPFYLMERLEGRVFAEGALPGVSPADRHAMYAAMADTMARLHRVDWQAVGLEGFGRPGNYFARQIARWTRQWELSKTREIPEIDHLIAWLPANIPAGDTTALCHGDLRLGNLMFHPTEPSVVGVLDWELSTLGHPLADVAYNCMAWRSRPQDYGGIMGLDLPALGIPGEAEYVDMYLRAARPADPLRPFHFAFSLFRFAVIFEGIAARVRAGTAASATAANTDALSLAFAQHAVAAIDGPPPYNPGDAA